MDKEHIYIYGAGNRGAELFELIRCHYADKIDVDGFIDRERKGILKDRTIYKTTDIKEKDIHVVISVHDFQIALEAALLLKKEGFRSVYWFDMKNERNRRKDFFAEQCVWCKAWDEDTLLHVELHAMDACNLNCEGCTHYAPIFEHVPPDTDRRLNDICLLGSIVKGGVVNFLIMGGEPFLNKDVGAYVRKAKEVFPYAAVTIVTNGLLIPDLPIELLHFISREHVCISISEYEPTHARMQRILAVLRENNILYNIRKFEGRQRFNKPLSLHAKGEKYCISNGCINIWNGKIARCPTLMYITELNQRFGLHFPEEGILDMESGVSGIELKRFLEREVPLCDYCIKNEIKWNTCKGNAKAKHFVKVN